MATHYRFYPILTVEAKSEKEARKKFESTMEKAGIEIEGEQ